MKLQCTENVHSFCDMSAPFLGRWTDLGRWTEHAGTLRAAPLNRERLFCCRHSEISACSLTDVVLSSAWGSSDLKSLTRKASRSHKTDGQATRQHHSENKSQLPSGFNPVPMQGGRDAHDSTPRFSMFAFRNRWQRRMAFPSLHLERKVPHKSQPSLK